MNVKISVATTGESANGSRESEPKISLTAALKNYQQPQEEEDEDSSRSFVFVFFLERTVCKQQKRRKRDKVNHISLLLTRKK